ncbi:MAG: F0F1 ATP synthase subunit B [Verrucomicrobiota bacterium]
MTLPALLAAAATTAEPNMFQTFGVETKYVAWQIGSFLIVLFVLYRIIKPITATMEERNRKIESGIKHAEEMQAKLAAAQAESAVIVKKANTEATRLIEEARKTSKEFLDKQILEATTKANEVQSKAQQAIELDRKKMLAEARAEIARLVVTTTERVLAKKLTDADRAAYNDAAARELTNV